MNYTFAVFIGVLTALPAAAQPLSILPATHPPAFDSATQTGPGSPDEATALAALVAELERNNPELKAARRDIDMRVARIAPAGAPPDPTLSMGYVGDFLHPFFPSSRMPDAFQQLGVSQEIPYPGKLALRTRVATTEADAERWNYEDRRRQLIADLKGACVEYVFVNRSLAIVQRNKELLEQFRKIAETQFSVGKGIQQDVLKAQVEISLLIERLAMLERQRGALQAEINGLLYRGPDTPVNAGLAFQTTTLTQNVSELRALAQSNYPALKRDEQVINRGQQALALTKKEVMPDFAVNFTTQRFNMDMPWMYGVDFMVKLPIYWQRKQRPMIAEATAALESGRLMRENTLAMAAASVTEQYLAVTTSRRLMDLYGDSILPQARLTLESSIAAYQVGSADFLTLLTNFMTVLTYEVNYEEQTAQYRQALARLEPLVGIELIK